MTFDSSKDAKFSEQRVAEADKSGGAKGADSALGSELSAEQKKLSSDPNRLTDYQNYLKALTSDLQKNNPGVLPDLAIGFAQNDFGELSSGSGKTDSSGNALITKDSLQNYVKTENSQPFGGDALNSALAQTLENNFSGLAKTPENWGDGNGISTSDLSNAQAASDGNVMAKADITQLFGPGAEKGTASQVFNTLDNFGSGGEADGSISRTNIDNALKNWNQFSGDLSRDGYNASQISSAHSALQDLSNNWNNAGLKSEDNGLDITQSVIDSKIGNGAAVANAYEQTAQGRDTQNSNSPGFVEGADNDYGFTYANGKLQSVTVESKAGGKPTTVEIGADGIGYNSDKTPNGWSNINVSADGTLSYTDKTDKQGEPKTQNVTVAPDGTVTRQFDTVDTNGNQCEIKTSQAAGQKDPSVTEISTGGETYTKNANGSWSDQSGDPAPFTNPEVGKDGYSLNVTDSSGGQTALTPEGAKVGASPASKEVFKVDGQSYSQADIDKIEKATLVEAGGSYWQTAENMTKNNGNASEQSTIEAELSTLNGGRELYAGQQILNSNAEVQSLLKTLSSNPTAFQAVESLATATD